MTPAAPTTRASELQDRLDVLRRWGMLALARMWDQVDPEDVRGSFLSVHPALVEVHRVQVIASLDAIDLYMFATAADAGLRYDLTWRQDFPGRPLTTASGRDARAFISQAPFVVLNRLGRGRGPAKSMLVGRNYLGRLFGSEPHRLARQVVWARFDREQ